MGHSPGDRRGIKNHAAFNPEVFYKLSPDLLLPHQYDPGQGVPSFVLPGSPVDEKYLKGLLGTRQFQSRYTLATLVRPEQCEAIVLCWVRRDRMNDLEQRGIVVRDLSREFLVAK
jgi:hypothetical protein